MLIQFRPEVLAEWERLRMKGDVTWDDWDDFLGDWEENHGDPKLEGATNEQL